MISPNKLLRAMNAIAEKKGDFTLFALVMRTDSHGAWDLVAAAPWLQRGKLKATSQLVQLLSKSMGKESLTQLARISTLDRDHPVVKFMLLNFPNEKGIVHVASTDLFPLQIEEAIIFRSRNPSVRRG